MKLEELFPDSTNADQPIRRRAWNGQAHLIVVHGVGAALIKAGQRPQFWRYAFSFEDAMADDWELVGDG